MIAEMQAAAMFQRRQQEALSQQYGHLTTVLNPAAAALGALEGLPQGLPLGMPSIPLHMEIMRPAVSPQISAGGGILASLAAGRAASTHATVSNPPSPAVPRLKSPTSALLAAVALEQQREEAAASALAGLADQEPMIGLRALSPPSSADAAAGSKRKLQQHSGGGAPLKRQH